MRTISGWNADNMFFLTRDGDITILHSDEEESNPTLHEPVLFRYSNQVAWERPPKDTIDEFGRNYIDKMFIRLCEIVHVLAAWHAFKSLSCRKIDDVYIARLEWDDEVIEMELCAMVNDLSQRYKST